MFRFFLLLLLCTASFGVNAAVWEVSTAPALTEALNKSKDGDTVRLQKARYEGSFEIRSALVMEGEEGAVLDAKGNGTCLIINSDNVTVKKLAFENFGSDLYSLDSGIRVKDGARNIQLENLKISGPGFGIRADHAQNITVRNTDIRGRKKMHVLDRGDGVYFNYVKNATLENNKVRFTRDGFYFENTDGTVSDKNYFAGLQYGIHYMYSRTASASDNKAEACIGGYALMSSEDLRLLNSVSDRTVEFGVLLNETDRSLVSGNRITRVHNPRGKAALDTEGKAVFVYGGGSNKVRDNSFETSDIGVSMAMGGEGTRLFNNRFVDNKSQVRYVGSKFVDWSEDGIGNYWSTYQGWDLNSDGIGDRAYQPNDALDRLFWLYPNARFLMDSPVVIFLRFLAKSLDLDKGCGVVDRFPIVKDPQLLKEKNS